MEKVLFTLDAGAVPPEKSYDADAGYDLVAISERIDVENRYFEYGTGVHIYIPKGYVGFLAPRSSNSNKDLTLSNSLGVLDSGFTGEIKFRYKPLSTNGVKKYKLGERIGQLVIVKLPEVTLELVDKLPDTERGTNGYGSTGT